MTTKVTLKNVRISFPDVFKPNEFKGKRSYRCKFLLEKGSENLKAISDAIKAEATEKWKAKAPQKLAQFKGSAQQNCLIDGDNSEVEGFAGHMILTANRAEKSGPPVVVDRYKKPLTESQGKIYSGCYCYGNVEIWAQDGENPGIRCTLINLQFYKDGESFGGAAPASADGLDDLSFEDDGEDAETDDGFADADLY